MCLKVLPGAVPGAMPGVVGPGSFEISAMPALAPATSTGADSARALAAMVSGGGAGQHLQLQRKVGGLPYDVEHPSVGRQDGVDTYDTVVRLNRMQPGNSMRSSLIQNLMPNAAPDVQIGPSFMIPDGSRAHIGAAVQIHGFVHLDDNGEVRIGDNVIIGAGTSLLTIEHPMTPIERLGNFVRVKDIAIGDNTIVGARCTILPGVTIGRNVWILNDSVVSKDVPDGVVLGGKPAEVLRSLTASEIASGMKGFERENPGIDESGRPRAPLHPSIATAEFLQRFNLEPMAEGLFEGAIQFLAGQVPTLGSFANNNIFPPFWCENGAHIKFKGPRAFINTGAIFHDGDPRKTITISQGVFFGPNVEIFGATTFGDAAWIGANSTIGEGAVIGRGAIVAAGSDIPSGASIPDFAIVGGDPWKVIRHVSREKDAWSFDEASVRTMTERLEERKVDVSRIQISG